MEFRVLGPLEVEAEGRSVPVPAGRPARILAVLLIHANEVVSNDRLLDAVWSNEAPPASGLGTLRTNVARLRRVIEPDRARGADPELLVTRPTGYCLQIGPDQLDCARFEQLLALAEGQATAGDPRAALGTLEQALGLWRGDAYGGFADEDWARAEAARLDELRAVALEERIDAELACGLHAKVVGELETVVDRHPLRSRPRGQLMVALHRAGRQAEALRAYQSYRQVLGEELGLEPPPELRALERRIAAHDPALELPAPVGQPLRGYRLLAEVGRGRWASVFRAAQPSVGRDVAVKVVDPAVADDPDFIRTFEVTAQRIARLEHPRIVPLHDFWRDATGAYLVVRWMSGGSLADRLSDPTPGWPDPVTALRTVEQVAEALASAHRHDVVHGHLDPTCVLFDAEGNAYVDLVGCALVGAPVPVDGGLELNRATDVADLGRLATTLLNGHASPALADVLRRSTSLTESERQVDVETFVAELGAATRGRGRLTVDSLPARNPFKGLRPFEESDAGDFFGREGLVEELVERLTANGPTARLVVVVGPSGSGKSSLVRAGVVPSLRTADSPGSRWFVATMVPGFDPFQELESALTTTALHHTAFAEALRAGSDGIRRGVSAALGEEPSELVLVIDQLEELFTLTDDESTRAAFLDGLVDAVEAPDSRVRIVATLRADFFDRPLRYQRFGQLLQASMVTLLPLAPAEIERAVVGPAERVGMAVEPALVAEVVADVVDQPAALPLLQYTLTELFEHHGDDGLTVSGYRAVGGVSSALNRRSELLYGSFDTEAQEATRLAFTRLVTLGEGVQDTRRRVLRAELEAAAGGRAAVDRVVGSFVRHRLLTLDRDPESRAPTVEIAHEALLRQWPRLRAWIDDDRDGLRIVRHIGDAARSWEASGHDPGELYRGGRLQAAVEWTERNATALTAGEQSFVGASRDAHEAEHRVEQERARSQIRQNRRLRRALTGIALAMVVALVAGAVALHQRNRAGDQRDQAEEQRTAAVAAQDQAELNAEQARAASDRADAARQDAEREARTSKARGLAGEALSLIDTDLDQALHKAVEAYDTEEDLVESRDALLTTLDAAGPLAQSISFGDDVTQTTVDGSGRRAAARSDGNRIQLWDIPGEQPLGGPFTVGTDEISSLAFDPAGGRLAVGYVTGTIEVWDLDPPALAIGPLRGPEAAVGAMAFNDDGSRLVTLRAFGPTAQVWDLTAETSIAELHGVVTISGMDVAGPVTFTGDATGQLQQWNTTTGEREGTPLPALVDDSSESGQAMYGQVISGAAVSRDGRQVAAGYNGRTVALWDVASRTYHLLPDAGGQNFGLRFSPDGTRLAASSTDGRTRVWETGFPDRRPTVLAAVWIAAFDGPDRVVTASANGVRTFDLATTATSEPAFPAFAGNGYASGVRFRPDGSLVATNGGLVQQSGRRSIALWAPGREEETLGLTLPYGLGDLDVSADGARAVVTTTTESVYVVDLESGTVEEIVTPAGVSPETAAFSPSGDLLAVAGEDPGGAITLLWYSVPAQDLLATTPIRAPIGSGGFPPRSLSFNRAGTKVVVGQIIGEAVIVDVADHTVDHLGDAAPLANTVIFGATESQLFAGEWFGAVKIVDLDHRDAPDRFLNPNGYMVNGLAISPDGSTLYSVSNDGGLVTWDVASGRRIGPPRRAPINPGAEEAPGANAIDLSTDSKVAAVAYSDGRIVLWNMDPESWAREACALVTRPLVGSAGGAAATDDDATCAAHRATGPPPAERVVELPTWPASTDATVASNTLLPASEYAPGWFDFFAGTRFDADLAGKIPGCADELDTVFESDERAATAVTKTFASDDQQSRANQYAVVFADEGAARDFYDTLHRPSFIDGCLAPYAELIAPGAVRDVGFGNRTFPFGGIPRDAPPFETVGDQSSVGAHEWTSLDTAGGRHGPELWYVATIRVGRTVTVIEVISRSGDQTVVSDDDFRRIVARVAERGRAALEGTAVTDRVAS